MQHKKSERGQAIILIVFAMIGLIGLTGLTVDGGIAYSDRRHAQNAADSAALAAALAHARGEDEDLAARSVATSNGYAANVVINPLPSPAGTCPNNTAPDPDDMNIENMDYTVEITSTVDTFFAPIVGIQTLTNKVTATSRACGTYIAPLFGGNAIVSCGDTAENYCSFDGGQSNSATWDINGGGIASDSCATVGNATVTLDSGECVSAVTTTTGFSSVCSGNATSQCDEDYLDSIFPPDPCVTNPTGIDVIKVEKLSRADINGMIVGGAIYFTDGIYCMDDLGNTSGQDPLSGQNIILDNATLYIRDMDFDLKFAGGGGFAGTPTTSGTYKDYSIIVARSSTPCPGTSGTGSGDAQVIDYRGGSGGVLGTEGLYGTILAPTACIDMRGNTGSGTDPLVINSQIIANKVSANGNASITVNYVGDKNHLEPVSPLIELLR